MCSKTKNANFLETMMDSDMGNIRHISKNPATPPNKLRQIFHSEKIHHNVIQDVVKNPSFPQASINRMLEFMSQDFKELDMGYKKYSITLAMLQNPNINNKFLSYFAKSKNKEVIKSILKNPSLAVEIIEDIGESYHPEILKAVASNPKIGQCPKVLGKIMKYSEMYEPLSRNANLPVSHIRYLETYFCKHRENNAMLFANILINPNTPLEILEKYEAKKNYNVILASNPKIPEKMLAKMVKTNSVKIKSEIITNIKNVYVLLKHAQHKNIGIKTTAVLRIAQISAA